MSKLGNITKDVAIVELETEISELCRTKEKLAQLISKGEENLKNLGGIINGMVERPWNELSAEMEQQSSNNFSFIKHCLELVFGTGKKENLCFGDYDLLEKLAQNTIRILARLINMHGNRFYIMKDMFIITKIVNAKELLWL